MLRFRRCMPLVLLAGVLCFWKVCTAVKNESPVINRLSFPKGFVFGTASSAYQGSHIVALIYNNQKDTYFSILKEGFVYTLYDFIVVAAAKSYRAVDRDLALTFYHRTEAKEAMDTPSIPRFKFELICLEKVPSLFSNVTNFIDNVVLSSRDGTKTYCNIDYAPFEALRADILAAIGHTAETLPSPRKSGFLTAAPITLDEVTIRHILDTETPVGKEVISFLCKATIAAVPNYDGWYYNACPKCPRDDELQGDKYYCVSCPGPANPVKQRYRVKVLVQDSTGSATFTIFRNQVEQLVGVPIEKVMGELDQDKLSNDLPPVLNNMVGKICLFEVRVTAYNKPGREGFTVARLSDAAVVIPRAGPTGGSNSSAGPSNESHTSAPLSSSDTNEGLGPSKKPRLD